MTFREATREDVKHIIAMIANDKLGKQREDFKDPLPQQYYDAFEKISKDANIELIVLEEKGEIIGTFHLTFMQHLTYQGGVRAQIEAVRVHEDQRGKGIGEQMFNWAIQRARDKGAHLIQLTTDKQRPEALHFYTKLGFTASHEGLKMKL